MLGPMPPITGSMNVVRLPTEGLEDLFGATFGVEPYPEGAAVLVRQYLENRRERLGPPFVTV